VAKRQAMLVRPGRRIPGETHRNDVAVPWYLSFATKLMILLLSGLLIQNRKIKPKLKPQLHIYQKYNPHIPQKSRKS